MTFEPPTSAPKSDRPETVAYTPEPERRPEWARSAWLDPAPGEPTTATTTSSPTSGAGSPPPFATDRAVGPTAERRRVGIGSIVAVSVLSAVLASGGTVVLLQSSGALV